MEYYRVLIYNIVAPFGGSPRWAQSAYGPNDADKGAMKAEGQARLEPPRNPGRASLDLCTCAIGCRVHMVRGDGHVTWRLCCTHRRHSCFLLVVMLLHCRVLPLHLWQSNGPAPVAVANAIALQLPLPPKPRWPVSPVSSGSSVILWAISSSPGTHGIELGRNHLSEPDAR